ncbi:MAG: hypothetical protein AB1792_07900 [Candidatus Zixiibacteriota bacterium]
MSVRSVCGIISCIVAFVPWEATAQSIPDLIFPDPLHEIVVAPADSCDGELPCGHILAHDDPLAGLILTELGQPFHRSLVKVTQCLRNLTGDTAGPNVLYVSSEEGGYARTGLAIIEGSTVHRFPKLHYVDLVLDSSRIANGEMDIFSHELGHVMMSIVWPDRWEGWTPKQHVSMGITDDYVAFSEGWGIHFQQLAMDQVERYSDLERETWNYTQDVRQLWHSHLDTRLRLEGVRHNDFIHRKVLPQVDTSGMSLTELIFLEHTSPLFDRCRLRSAQEMLASEGVVATIFYRMATDTVLSRHYLDWTFYRPFLRHPAPTTLRPRDVFTPLENIILKTARVWQAIRPTVDSSSAPMISFIKSWCDLYPEDRRELLSLFLATTVAKTATDELGILYERTAYTGTTGRIMDFRRQRAEYDSAFTRIRDDVLAGTRALDGNVGTQLWVENHAFSIPATIFFPEPTQPLRVNLNTANVFDLATFPGMTLDRAMKVVSARDSLGWFRSLEQARTAGWH